MNEPFPFSTAMFGAEFRPPEPLARIVRRSAPAVRYAIADGGHLVPATERPAAPPGRYRVIHGRVCVPRADAPAPSGDPWQLGRSVDYAEVGDVLEISDAADAARMLEHSIIEPIDANPSRLGKVWEPAKVWTDPRIPGASEYEPPRGKEWGW